MLAASKVKLSSSEKKVNKNMYEISSIKRVTRKFLSVWKFHFVVVQNKGK